jgi:hypothetical protein
VNEKLHRLAKRVGSGVLLMLLLACTGAANDNASEAEVRHLQLYIGDSIRIESGFGARLLNLDPSLVKLSTHEPGRIELEGLKYGTATVWIWSTSATTVLRVRILGHRPAVSEARELAPPPARPFFLKHSFRYFGYRTSGGRTDTDNIGAHDLEVEVTRASFRTRGRLWTEAREGELDVPQYDVLIERENGTPIGHASLHLGTVRPDWSPFTFYRERIRGGRLELRSASGDRRRSRLLVELCYGKDIPDYVVLGSRNLVDAATDSRLGGGRLLWRPRQNITTTAEIGIDRDHEGESRTVTALGADGRFSSLGFGTLWAHDGEQWATQGTVRWSARETTVSMGGKYRQSFFRTLHGGSSLPGSRYANVGVDRSFGHRLRLSGESSWQRWERLEAEPSTAGSPSEIGEQDEDSWRDHRHHSLRATYRLGSRLRASGWWRLDDNGTWDIHWKRQRKGVELAASGLMLAADRGPTWGWRVGAENTNERASDLLEGEYARQSVYIQPELSLSNCLGVNFRVEAQFAEEGAPDEPSRYVWNSHAYACVPPFSLFRGGMLTAGFRKWEYLSSTDGLFVSGRHLSARVELGSRPFSGVTLEVLGTWEQDIDLEVTNTSIQVALSHELGTGERSARGRPVPEGTVRGCVFHDRNGDGIREENEPGLRGMRVRLDDGRETLTDEKGEYRFRSVWGRHALVRIMTEPIEAELAATTPVVQRVEIAQAGRVRADFGLGPAPPMLEVLAYNDLNENERRDDGEPLVPDVLLYLNELDVQLRTRADGATRQELPANGVFTGTWSHRSLPTGYSPIGSWKEATPATETGRTTRWELPLRALRSLRGQVFLDGNRNRRRDRGEPSVAGVVLRAGERFTVSSTDGRFLLKALPPGEVEIVVPGEGVPAGWSLPQPKRIELEAGPSSLEGVDIPLQPAG